MTRPIALYTAGWLALVAAFAALHQSAPANSGNHPQVRGHSAAGQNGRLTGGGFLEP